MEPLLIGGGDNRHVNSSRRKSLHKALQNDFRAAEYIWGVERVNE